MTTWINGGTRSAARRAPVGRAAMLMLTLGAVVACSKPAEPVKITRADLSTQLNADRSISSASETFAPTSTVYGSVATEGSGSATLTAKWVSADGQVLAEQKQPITPTRPEFFEFHFAPPGGWPKGRHKVIFAIDGTGARTREFEVR
jgi:hypothetical protein